MPTRDVLVVFDDSGDREFIGFGSAKAHEFADCFISADALPEDTIRVSSLELFLLKDLYPLHLAIMCINQIPVSILLEGG